MKNLSNRFAGLISMDKSLQIKNTNAVAKIEFPKLKIVVENVTLQSSNNSNTIQRFEFPVLKKVGAL